jgi:hypothetical protein
MSPEPNPLVRRTPASKNTTTKANERINPKGPLKQERRLEQYLGREERRLEQRNLEGGLGEAGADSACSSGTRCFLADAGAGRRHGVEVRGLLKASRGRRPRGGSCVCGLEIWTNGKKQVTALIPSPYPVDEWVYPPPTRWKWVHPYPNRFSRVWIRVTGIYTQRRRDTRQNEKKHEMT